MALLLLHWGRCGPLQGAANKKVMDMMSDIKANVSNWTDRSEVSAYLEKIVRKEAYDNTGKIYGWDMLFIPNLTHVRLF